MQTVQQQRLGGLRYPIY